MSLIRFVLMCLRDRQSMCFSGVSGIEHGMRLTVNPAASPAPHSPASAVETETGPAVGNGGVRMEPRHRESGRREECHRPSRHMTDSAH